jgi:hypothetical protein
VAGLFGWATKRPAPEQVAAAPDEASADPKITSKVLPRLLAALAPVEGPALLNLGPVIGQNIAFFGDRLSCKISIEDLFVHVDDHAAGKLTEPLADVLERRLPDTPAIYDGILCWDLFDFLDKPTSQRVGARLAVLLKPGGVLYGFFGTSSSEVKQHTRFVVEAPDTLRLRAVPSPPLKRHVLVNRDLNRTFDGLSVAESILLKTSTRETLFRKG